MNCEKCGKPISADVLKRAPNVTHHVECMTTDAGVPAFEDEEEVDTIVGAPPFEEQAADDDDD